MFDEKLLSELESVDTSVDKIDFKDDLDKIDIDSLNVEILNLNNSLLVLQKLCLYYEDLSNRKDDVLDSSLLSKACKDLSQDSEEYNNFVRFLLTNKNRLSDYRGVEEYLNRLQTQIMNFNKRFDSK